MAAVPDPARDLLPARVERELRRAADEEIGVRLHLRENRLVRGEVDAEGLLPEQVLPGLERGEVDLLMEVVRDGAVHGLYGFVLEHLAVIAGKPGARVEPLVPGEDGWVRVAD